MTCIIDHLNDQLEEVMHNAMLDFLLSHPKGAHIDRTDAITVIRADFCDVAYSLIAHEISPLTAQDAPYHELSVLYWADGEFDCLADDLSVVLY